MHYCSPDDVKLALRAPQSGVASWDANTYDQLIADCIMAAGAWIDEQTDGWSPFNASTEAATARTYTAIDEGRLLVTDPFRFAPEAVTVRGVAWSGWQLHIPIRGHRSGKSLRLTVPTTLPVVVTAAWGHQETPRDIKLACVRIAAQMFSSQRVSPAGVMEIGGGPVYEPRYDPTLDRYLSRYRSGRV